MNNEVRRTKYDGVTVFLPRIDLLEVGDILLTFNSESDDRRGIKQSRIIRTVTGGDFSHALICSTPPTFVEAIGTGVSTLSLGRCFAHHIENVRLLRYPDRDISRKAAQLSQDEIGRDYSVARAIRSVFPSDLLDRIDDHGTFCSALVAQAFTIAGAGIFSAVPPDRTTPATIEKLTGLIDLTTSAFRAALSPSNIEAMSALDGDRAPTMSARQTVISAECARQIWPRADAIARSYPELALSPGPSFYGLLRFLTDATDRAHVVSSQRRLSLETELRRLDEALATFLEKGDLQRLILDVNADDDKIMIRNLTESYKSKPDIDLDAMVAYLKAGELQLAQRVNGINEWQKWDPVRSRALSIYLQIDIEAANAVHRRNTILREMLHGLGISTSTHN